MIMAGHARWVTTKHKRLAADVPVDEEYAQAYAQAELEMQLAEAVYRRRKELGISQVELAERADMTQPQVSRLETGGAIPTLPLLRRLARALEADIVVHGDDDDRVPMEFMARGSAA
jgi:ribosome-binding protein aMBF1 (putative translation factor)